MKDLTPKFGIPFSRRRIRRSKVDTADVNKIEKMLVDFKDEIKQEFRHQLGIQAENFQNKLDAVAADLKAHRADTEAHPPVYRVKE